MTAARNAVLSAALVIMFWQGLVSLTGVPHYILPGPLRVAAAFRDNIQLIAWHSGITLSEVVLGLAIGAGLGAASALWLVASPASRAVVRPVLVFSQAIPVFALAPILTLWLGYGLWSKVAMAVLIIYFPVTSSFFDGLMRTPRGWLDMASTMGARPRSVLFRIRVPAAMPAFGSGLRLAAVYAPVGAVIGEWVGASQGLGYLMLLANGRAKIDLMFAALITLGAMSLLFFAAVNLITTRFEYIPDA